MSGFNRRVARGTAAVEAMKTTLLACAMLSLSGAAGRASSSSTPGTGTGGSVGTGGSPGTENGTLYPTCP